MRFFGFLRGSPCFLAVLGGFFAVFWLFFCPRTNGWSRKIGLFYPQNEQKYPPKSTPEPFQNRVFPGRRAQNRHFSLSRPIFAYFGPKMPFWSKIALRDVFLAFFKGSGSKSVFLRVWASKSAFSRESTSKSRFLSKIRILTTFPAKQAVPRNLSWNLSFLRVNRKKSYNCCLLRILSL